MKEKREIAQSEALDKTVKIVSGLVPGGASVYELFTAIVTPLHKQRREEWVREVTMRLHYLEMKDKINLVELSKSEEFNTIITKATLLAQQNHQQEKLEALRTIVVNSALYGNDPTEMFDWAERFLYIVDRISPFHILLLKTLKSPTEAVENKSADLSGESMMSTKDLFFIIYPDYRDRSMLIAHCWKELIDLGLVNNESFENNVHEQDSLRKLTNDFGDKFLEMIEEKG